MKDFSKFKVLGITLLVTMSSCVVGAIDLNAETLRSYGFEFDISTNDKVQSYQKSKRVCVQNPKKYSFNKLVESGRYNFIARGLTLEPYIVLLRLSPIHFNVPLINREVNNGIVIQKSSYIGASILNRAGPISYSI